MTAELKAMLDELMGRDRDLSLQEKEKQADHWSDESVCKMFLVKFCPHDLFTNTKADLGTCKSQTHDVKTREDYRGSIRFKKLGYESGFLRTLEGVVEDMEKKIRRQHERLEHDEKYMKQEQQKADDFRNSRLDSLTTKIDELLEQMSEAGSEGNVDEAQQMMKQVEAMRQEREAIKASRNDDPQKKVFLPLQVKQNVPFINEMKHMEVCPVCGAFLVVNDTQTRVDAHLSGKQHMGYAMIRETIKDLRAERDADLKVLEEAHQAEVANREAEREAKEKVNAEAKKDTERSRDDRGRSRDNRSRDGSRRSSQDRSRSSRGGDRRYDRRSGKYEGRDRTRDDRRDRRRGSPERRGDRGSRTSSGDKSKTEGDEVVLNETGSDAVEPDITDENGHEVGAEPASSEIQQDGTATETVDKSDERRPRSRDRMRSRDRRSSSRDRSRRQDRSRDRSRRDRSKNRRRRSRSRDRKRSRSYERKRSRY